MKHTLRILLLVALSLCGSFTNAQTVVVVGAQSSATALTIEQAANIFLGKTSQLPGVGNAVVLDQSESQAIRDIFYTKVAGKSAAQVKSNWSRLVFSGKATSPIELSGSAEVKKVLAANPNSIGYLEKSDVDDSVKVLLSVD
jgi:ABC-type phosphate transport system substrate-binding protein